MHRVYSFVLAGLCIATSAPLGLAQQTVNVTDGINSFVWTVDETETVEQTFSAANSGTVFPSDILYEEGWFLNVGGQVTRLADIEPGSIMISGSNSPVANISYSNVQVAGELFGIDLTYQVGTSPTGVMNLNIGIDLTHQGSSAVPVSGSLINYFDYDINGSQNQIAVFTDSSIPTITQLNPATGESFSRTGLGMSAFDIAPYSSLLDSIGEGALLDSTPDLGVIDVTAAFQWDFSLGGGTAESVSFAAGGFGEFGVVTVPEPSGFLMMSLLSVMMTLKRVRILD